jgi:GntR family transcriptional regulator
LRDLVDDTGRLIVEHTAKHGLTGLDRVSKVPLYHQLYNILRQKIDHREWIPEQVIPTEKQLTEEFGVSRVTVRQVLERLANEGFIYRQRGRGSFVSPPRLEEQMSRFVDFSEDMRQRGFTPRTELIESGIATASDRTAQQLGMEIGDQIYFIRRLRLADDEPLSVEESCLVSAYCPGILDHDFSKESLRAVLESEYNIVWLRAQQTIRAVPASADVASLLKIKRETPYMFIERISYSQTNQPVEFLMIHYHPRYTLHNELNR